MAIKAKKSTNGTGHKAATRKVTAGVSGRPAQAACHDLEQRIRERAYHLYLKRGTSQGRTAADDWCEAEKQIKRELRLN